MVKILNSARIWRDNDNCFVTDNTILICKGGHIVLESFKTVQIQKNNFCCAICYKMVAKRTWYRIWWLCPSEQIFTLVLFLDIWHGSPILFSFWSESCCVMVFQSWPAKMNSNIYNSVYKYLLLIWFSVFTWNLPFVANMSFIKYW